MAVKGITFFKVPFDNTYRNVYTFPSSVMTTQIIYQKFYANFPHYDYVSSEKTLDFKITNGKIMLTVKGDSVSRNYFNIKDYNYCALNQNIAGVPEWRFYFISSVSSLNQGPTPSTAVNLEYDCWHNNLFYIKNDRQQFTMTKGHILDCKQVGDEIVTRNIPCTTSELAVKREIVLSGSPTILWLKLTLGVDRLYEGTDTTVTTKNLVWSAVNASAQLPILYFPVGVYLPEEGIFADAGEYTLQVYNEKAGGSASIQIPKLSFMLDDTGYIVEAEYTYFTPFKVLPSSTDKVFKIPPEEGLELTNYFDKITDGEVTRISNVAVGFLPSGNVRGVVAANVGRRQSSLNDMYFLARTNLPTIDATYYNNDTFALDKLPQINQAPFISYELMTNGERLPIEIPENYNFFMIHYLVRDESIYRTIQYDALGQFSTVRVATGTNGFIPISSDQASLYYRNQGNQILAQQNAIGRVHDTKVMTNAIGAIGNTVSGVMGARSQAGAMASLVGTAASYTNAVIENELNTELKVAALEAKRADVNNALISRQTVTSNANDEIYDQNYPYIIKCTALESESKRQLLNNIYRYGPTINAVDTINTLAHKVFNFKRYSSYEANYIPNYQERHILESILTSGVTIWNFIVDNDSTLVKNAKLAMTKTVNNPCILEA